MDTFEATATIVKAALDNKLLSLSEPDKYSNDSIAKSNSFNISQLCLLIKSVENELVKTDEEYSPVSF